MNKKTEIKFILTFIPLLIFFHSAYYLFRSETKIFFVQKTTISAVVNLINTITPFEKTMQCGDEIRGNRFSMAVKNGCDGMDGILIIAAAMLSFPMGLKAKLLGTIFGLAVVYLTNIMRITGLYYILSYKPVLFHFFHVYVGQFIVIFTGGVFFLIYIRYVQNKDDFA